MDCTDCLYYHESARRCCCGLRVQGRELREDCPHHTPIELAPALDAPVLVQVGPSLWRAVPRAEAVA